MKARIFVIPTGAARSVAQWRDLRLFCHSTAARRNLLFRTAQIAAVFLLAITILGASDTSSRFNNLGHKMVCPCGCNEILLECNHVGCPDSDRMIGELRDQLASGNSDTAIFNWFAAKYGPTVLAAPIRGGFDSVAWITPISIFFLAIFATILVVRKWKLRTVAANVGTAAQEDPLRERIRKETEY